VHQIFEVPPAPLYVLGSDLQDPVGTVDPDGDGRDGRPRSIGPLGGSGNGLPAGPPPAPEAPEAAEAAEAAGGPGRPQPAPRRRPWWRRI
jgi:hypothetical protein